LCNSILVLKDKLPVKDKGVWAFEKAIIYELGQSGIFTRLDLPERAKYSSKWMSLNNKNNCMLMAVTLCHTTV
jgi:hypothetical protein